MAIKAITGIGLFQETKIGKELLKLCPKGITRMIIDIQPLDVVTIYYQSVDSREILNLDWDEVIGDFKVVRVEDMLSYDKKKYERELLNQAERDRRAPAKPGTIEECLEKLFEAGEAFKRYGKSPQFAKDSAEASENIEHTEATEKNSQ